MEGPPGTIGTTGPIGPTGIGGNPGPTGPTGVGGPTGPIGIGGPTGIKGEMGTTGIKGSAGPAGAKGEIGATGPTGIEGAKGEPGKEGAIGLKGPTGDIGQNAAISSIFVWSAALQKNINIAKFQYVTFENNLIGPTGSGWTSAIEPGYTFPTNFIVPKNGFYLLTYKLDVRSGSGQTPNYTNCTTVLTMNNIVIPGSTTLVEAPETGHIYTISNTVLVHLNLKDSISLLFWSTDSNTQIGDPSFVKGILPSGLIPVEATASIVFSCISN